MSNVYIIYVIRIQIMRGEMVIKIVIGLISVMIANVLLGVTLAFFVGILWTIFSFYHCDEAIYYLSKSIEFIGKVDYVYFMKGWEKARGYKTEHELAVAYGKISIYVN